MTVVQRAFEKSDNTPAGKNAPGIAPTSSVSRQNHSIGYAAKSVIVYSAK